jgi:ABC-type phosphate/phosphonate transport system permease subunit
MTKRWKQIILTVIIIVVIMVLFPPFHVIYAPDVIINKGHAFLLNPPRFQDTFVSTVDVNKLLAQTGAVAVVGLLYGFLFKKSE